MSVTTVMPGRYPADFGFRNTASMIEPSPVRPISMFTIGNTVSRSPLHITRQPDGDLRWPQGWAADSGLPQNVVREIAHAVFYK